MIPGVQAVRRRALIDGDPFFDKVVSLLHMEGADASNGFYDVKGNVWAVGTAGTALEVDQARFGGSSLLSPGAASNILSTGAGTIAQMAGDFTVECWLHIAHTGSLTYNILSLGNEATGRMALYIPTTNIPSYNIYSIGSVYALGSTPVPRNQWFHLAFCRIGNAMHAWINGVWAGTTSGSFGNTVGNAGGFGNVAGNSTSGYVYMDELRVTKGLARYAPNVSFAPPNAAYFDGLPGLGFDPYYDKTSLLLHGDAADASTIFKDSSYLAHQITTVNGSMHKTDDYVFGTSSLYFDGGTDSITMPAHAGFDFGAGDFTIEFRYKPLSVTGNKTIMTNRASAGSDPGFWLAASGTVMALTGWGPAAGTALVSLNGGALVINQWSGWALTRNGAVWSLFQDGALVARTTASGALAASTNLLRLGTDPSTAGRDLHGYLDEVRVTKGFSRYNQSYSLATKAFANSSTPQADPHLDKTVLLLDFEGMAHGTSVPADKSLFRQSLTTSGGASDANMGAFGGGCYRFTANNQFIKIFNNTDSSQTAPGAMPWTFECRVRPTAFAAAQIIFDTNNNSSNTTGIQIYIGTDGLLRLYSGAQALGYGAYGPALVANVWSAIRVTWDGTVLRFYVNGTLLGASPTGMTNVWGNTLYIGNSSYASQGLIGYIDDVRLTRGIARSYGDDPYLSTALLLHGIGANTSTTFVDNSPLPLAAPTVFGNAQISTARAKFGTSSMLFDGTGDAILYAHYGAHALAGDFTIEGWFYAQGSGIDRVLLGKGGGPGIGWASYQVVLHASGQLRFAASSANTSYDIGAESGTPGLIGTPSTGAWHHFAVTRQGNEYRTFLNGVAGWAATLALTPYDSSPRGLVIGARFTTTWGSGTPTEAWNGNLADIRISNAARYVSAFTPPGAPFPDGPLQPIADLHAPMATAGVVDAFAKDVVLYLGGDGVSSAAVFKDQSPYPKAITTVDGVKVNASACRFGNASLLFDGAGDYLTTPHHADFLFTSDMTIEAWVNPDVVNKQNTIIGKRSTVGNANGWQFQLDSTSRLSIYAWDGLGSSYSVGLVGTRPIVAGVWQHVAAVRKGNVWTLYVDGQPDASATEAAPGPAANTEIVVIGRDPNVVPTRDFDGWMDELRVTRAARYTTAFYPAVPTGLLPTTQGTVAFRAAGTQIISDAVTAVAPVVPAGVVDDDLLLAFIMMRSPLLTIPTGWHVVSSNVTNDSVPTMQYAYTLAKKGLASDIGTAPSFVQTSSGRIVGQIVAFSGTNGTPYIESVSETSIVNQTANAIPVPTVAVQGAGRLAVAQHTVCAVAVGPATETFTLGGTGWTLRSTATVAENRQSVSTKSVSSAFQATLGSVTGSSAAGNNGLTVNLLILASP